MNISKLIIVPALLIGSLVSAEKLHVGVEFGTDQDKKYAETEVILEDVKSNLLLPDEDQPLKIELEKIQDSYHLAIWERNAAGEWELLCHPELTLAEGSQKGLVAFGDSSGKSIAVTLDVIAE